MIKIKNCHPIICPQRKFIDAHNDRNAFVDTNPSLYIDKNGKILLFVRQVNYRKFSDGSFILTDRYCVSKYMCFHGTVLTDDNDGSANLIDLNRCTCIELMCPTNYPTFDTFWKGFEDIRFIDENNILLTCPEFNPTGKPCIFTARINNNIIDFVKKCDPGEMEKNWMPFKSNSGEYKVIYSVNPFSIKSIIRDDRETIDLSDDVKIQTKGYSGSTNGILFQSTNSTGTEVLFLIHNSESKTLNRWLLFDQVAKTVKVSAPFVFFMYSYIEFPCSLTEYKDRIFIALGVNDDKAFILEVDKSVITNLF